ncbi:hypothetical protein HYU91_02555 [Candidatus Collierbacteria bacterium]|nr:hypothetical protein [Candidatus Collierbacteria bacterium]
MDIFEKINSLNLPPSEFVVIGGSALECYGIRESGDVDLCITLDLYNLLVNSGWVEENKPNGSKIIHPKLDTSFELGLDWSYGDYHATHAELITRSSLIRSLNVASLNDILAYKKELGREKDQEDIRLINDYLMKKNRQ